MSKKTIGLEYLPLGWWRYNSKKVIFCGALVVSVTAVVLYRQYFQCLMQKTMLVEAKEIIKLWEENSALSFRNETLWRHHLVYRVRLISELAAVLEKPWFDFFRSQGAVSALKVFSNPVNLELAEMAKINELSAFINAADGECGCRELSIDFENRWMSYLVPDTWRLISGVYVNYQEDADNLRDWLPDLHRQYVNDWEKDLTIFCQTDSTLREKVRLEELYKSRCKLKNFSKTAACTKVNLAKLTNEVNQVKSVMEINRKKLQTKWRIKEDPQCLH